MSGYAGRVAHGNDYMPEISGYMISSILLESARLSSVGVFRFVFSKAAHGQVMWQQCREGMDERVGEQCREHAGDHRAEQEACGVEHADLGHMELHLCEEMWYRYAE